MTGWLNTRFKRYELWLMCYKFLQLKSTILDILNEKFSQFKDGKNGAFGLRANPSLNQGKGGGVFFLFLFRPRL